MFGKIAADALGLSDIGRVVDPSDYDKVESDDYILNEDNEKIYFLIKSKSDEYCFTNLALIHLDGTSAMSKKRALKRFDYKTFPLKNVWLETAGTVDLDIEIKFVIGEIDYSIDVDKKQLEKLKDLYKALTKIASIQSDNKRRLEFAEGSVETAVRSVSGGMKEGTNLAEEFSRINEAAYNWRCSRYDELVRKDFGEVFDHYIMH